MLKRHQVLLEDWMVKYARFLSEKYDLSFSEIIRGMFSLAIVVLVLTLYPKYKHKKEALEIRTLIKRLYLKKSSETDVHTLISTLYFEARKAAEFSMLQNKKLKSKI